MRAARLWLGSVVMAVGAAEAMVAKASMRARRCFVVYMVGMNMSWTELLEFGGV